MALLLDWEPCRPRLVGVRRTGRFFAKEVSRSSRAAKGAQGQGSWGPECQLCCEGDNSVDRLFNRASSEGEKTLSTLARKLTVISCQKPCCPSVIRSSDRMTILIREARRILTDETKQDWANKVSPRPAAQAA